MSNANVGWGRITISGVFLVALSAGAAYLVCRSMQPPPEPVVNWRTLTDCPPYWGSPLKDGKPDSVVPLAGPIRDTPEYHDCQRLVTGRAYGPLAAVFASHELDRLVANNRALRELSGRPMAVAAATILAIDGGFASLGLRQGANCLYLWQDNAAWLSRMVPVADAGEQCLEPLDPTTTTGTDLFVREVQVPAGRTAPAVARWELASNDSQAIGIRCGQQWCLIGPQGIQERPVPNVDVSGAFNAWLAARQPGDLFAVKGDHLLEVARERGWMDEQYLAEPNATTPTVSELWAGIIPSPRIQSINRPEGFNAWRLAAVIYIPTPATAAGRQTLDAYRTKLNYSDGWNAITMCRGNGCGETMSCPLDNGAAWYARIQPRTPAAGQAATRTFCVRRCAHLDVIGTARWRWVSKDETTWTRCADGCCEVEN